MKSISDVFERLRTSGRRALIPYFMGLYPGAEAFAQLLLAAQAAGADVIEVGIPFSDPIADGPAIQEAANAALSEGATAQRILEVLGGLHGQLSVPLVAMCYANVILRFGLDDFFRQAFNSGVRGAIIPDLVLEESAPFRKAAAGHGVDLVQLVAPTTPRDRLKDIAAAARGFIYLVSVTGVTGARPGEKFDLDERVRALREVSDLPVCVGFGIATAAQAAQVASVADGVIIGSALIRIMKGRDAETGIRKTTSFLRDVRKAIDTGE